MVALFKTIFTPEMESMGFLRKGSVFHKLVNEKILFLVGYRTYSGGREITVQFDFYPMCDGFAPNPPPMAGLYTILGFTREESDQTRKFFMVPTKSEQEYNKQIKFMLDVCKEEVFPYFDSIYDYDSYFKFFRKFHHVDEDIATKKYELMNSPVNLPLNRFFYVLLAIGKYDLALLAREARVQLLKGNIEDNARRNNIEFHQERSYRKYLAEVEFYEKIKDMIERNDVDAINELVRANAEFSLKSYYENFNVKRN